CLKDTCEDIVEKVLNWEAADYGPHIFWLHGLAGLGKSTITCTVADRLEILATTFFFSQDSTNCSNIDQFFPTIAQQLAISHSFVCKDMDNILKKDLYILDKDPKPHFKTLILDMICCYAGLFPALIVVIDALDEC
ncbi:hypothetical protein JAAARDRAFT_107722, partial [Jaapia argillacea MUCL 33604]